MVGEIFLWFGAIGAIPAQWSLCDGTNGTPDLTDRFLVGAGDSLDPDNTGGSVDHQHAFISDGHIHGIPGAAAILGGTDTDGVTTSNVIIGDTDSASSLPPFHSLAFIMFTG